MQPHIKDCASHNREALYKKICWNGQSHKEIFCFTKWRSPLHWLYWNVVLLQYKHRQQRISSLQKSMTSCGTHALPRLPLCPSHSLCSPHSFFFISWSVQELYLHNMTHTVILIVRYQRFGLLKLITQQWAVIYPPRLQNSTLSMWPSCKRTWFFSLHSHWIQCR